MTHCTKCGITWATLHTFEDESSDEVYEVCPVCRTDNWLHESDATEGCMMCPFNGEVINTVTGEHRAVHTPSLLTVSEQQAALSWEDYHRQQSEWEQQEDARIAAYFQTL